MEFKFMNHFIIADSGKEGPIYVAPHAGIAFKKPGDLQDENTHYIAYRLAQKGGRALIANITREKDIGIDLFRSPPPSDLAIQYYDAIKKDKKRETRHFRKKYAWVAKDLDEHNYKANIFNSFWTKIIEAQTPIVFIHRQYLNPIRHPSIMDVIPFNYENKVKAAINDLNNEYNPVFRELFKMYKQSFSFKSNCILFKKDLEKYGLNLFKGKEPRIYKRIGRFKQKIEKMPYIYITYKKNFKGDSIREVVEKHLINKGVPIIELEISEFLTKRYPELAVKIIDGLLKKI